MTETEKSTKTGADVAHFYRALGRAGAEGMPMPRDIHHQASGRMMLVFTAEDTAAVDAWAKVSGVEVGHAKTTHNTDGEWHAYGTAWNREGHWRGFPVQMWCRVDGPAPESAVKS